MGLALIIPSNASAQAVTGTLLGNVTDSSGGAVPGATVTARETQTNVSRTTVTNETGHYTFSSLLNGTYAVDAELQGFKKVLREERQGRRQHHGPRGHGARGRPDDRDRRVAAETPVLQTDRTDTGRIIESKMVAELPLTFNRNFQSLMLTVPGVTRPHREHSQFFNSQDSLRFEVNGQPGMASNTLIEGLDDNHKTGLLQVIIPAADALETVNVTTSNYDAEFGRSGGAITNVTIKSGTNELKGSGVRLRQQREDQRQRLLHAPEGADQVPQQRLHAGRADRPEQAVLLRRLPAHRRQQRLRRPRHGADDGDAQRRFQRGDERHLRSADRRRQRHRPHAVRQQPHSAGPHQPDRAPAAGVHSGAEHRGDARAEQLPQAAQREKTTDGFDAKVNHAMSEKDQMSYRVSFMRPVVFDPGLFGEYGGPANGGFAGTGTNNSSSTAVTWTRVFSAKTVIDVRGGLNYYHNITSTTGQGLTTSTEVGIPGANLNDFTSGISTSTSTATPARCSASRPASRGIAGRRPGTSPPR